MPKKLDKLERNCFVYSPELPPNEELAQYVEKHRDRSRLHSEWSAGLTTLSETNQPTSGKDWPEAMRQLGFLPFEVLVREPQFVSAHDFFTEYRPIRDPFSIWYSAVEKRGTAILQCVLDIVSKEDIAAINSAIAEEEPFYWQQDPAAKYRWYLFGVHLWEPKRSEEGLSQDEFRLLLLKEAARERRKFERLRREFDGVGCKRHRVARETIPEDVRIFVWRRDEGKCVKCGSNERLEYDHIIPVSKGGSNTERNVQLLCEGCNRSKGASVE